MSRIFYVGILLTATLATAGCKSVPPPGAPGPVHHVIVCWLHEPGKSGHRKKIIDVSHELQKLPGVVTAHAGGVVPSERPVVDNSYDVAVIMTFNSVDDMKGYLADPRHTMAVEKVLKPLVQRMIVYDFIDGEAIP